MNLLPMVMERDGVPVTTSRAVAEQFGKNHKNVIRAIETISVQLSETEDGKEFTELNFELSEYTDATGRNLPAYILTRDGFTILAMGFTGAKAMQFKIAYIDAFNRMERALSGAPALQSLENRIADLEHQLTSTAALPPKTSKRNTPSSNNDVAESFLQAIRAALESGNYHLAQRWKKKGAPAPQGELLGIVDSYTVIIKTVLAYKIYADSVKDPIPNIYFWRIMEDVQVITPRGKGNDKVKQYQGKSFSAAVMPLEKLYPKKSQR